MAWPKERVDKMVELHHKGWSRRDIAAELGYGVTRNAVIGRLGRMGLLTRANDGKQGQKAQNRKYKAPKPKPKPVVPAILSVEPEARAKNGSYVTIMSVDKDDCRWPMGDPGTEDFHFCGNPRDTSGVGSAYCAAHRQKATQVPVGQASRGFTWNKSK